MIDPDEIIIEIGSWNRGGKSATNILKNLRLYPGIVEDQDRIETFNDILNDLNALGFWQAGTKLLHTA